MTKRSAAFAIALALGAVPLHSAADAQSADLVLCDRVAADPADPDKPKDIAGVQTIAPSDIPLALKYCRIAAGSSRRALYELGRAYAANRQMPEAIATYRKAADKGSSSAMIELGVFYANGIGLGKDEAQARALFERAAKTGNPRGDTNLAALSTAGGTPADPVQARALLSKAAEANSAEAEFQLGIMYANGAGGPQDDVAARALFDKAAAQNHPRALEWMGSFAQSGRGGPQDSAAAKEFYRRAAALGNEDAKATLKELECPLRIKDKNGKFVSNLCF